MQLRVGPDPQTSASVRVIPYPSPPDPTGQKDLIDAELKSVNIVDETRIAVQGVAGWQAIYGVQASAGLDVHVHVFLFAPGHIHTIVFETLRTSLPQY
ncbi:MAG: hypothetical protein ABR532_08700, partial [Candidatus Dormibacteria bacterium]